MKENYTHISFVLDKSSSMNSIKKETIEGFNIFLKAQKEAPGEATFSLTQFSNYVTNDYAFRPIASIEEMNDRTYQPQGMTALYDAIGFTVKGCGERLAALPEADRPEKVVIVILTDGEENSSRKITYANVQQMIKDQTDKYSWEFIFLGANLNAEELGASLGIKAGNSMTFAANSAGTHEAFGSMSCNLTSYRGMSKGAIASADYTFFKQEDKDLQTQAGV